MNPFRGHVRLAVRGSFFNHFLLQGAGARSKIHSYRIVISGGGRYFRLGEGANQYAWAPEPAGSPLGAEEPPDAN